MIKVTTGQLTQKTKKYLFNDERKLGAGDPQVEETKYLRHKLTFYENVRSHNHSVFRFLKYFTRVITLSSLPPGNLEIRYVLMVLKLRA